MGVISFRQPTVAACWGGRCIPFLRALLVQVTSSAPQAAGRLLVVCPDFSELLADPRYIASRRTQRKHCFLYCCVLIHCLQRCLPHKCVAMSVARTHRKRRLQHLFYCCMTSQRTWHIPLLRVYEPLPSNGSFSASRSCFQQVRHMAPSLRLFVPSSLSVRQLRAPADLPPGKEALVSNVFPFSTLILFQFFT
jgi:hypothetical protein